MDVVSFLSFLSLVSLWVGWTYCVAFMTDNVGRSSRRIRRFLVLPSLGNTKVDMDMFIQILIPLYLIWPYLWGDASQGLFSSSWIGLGVVVIIGMAGLWLYETTDVFRKLIKDVPELLIHWVYLSFSALISNSSFLVMWTLAWMIPMIMLTEIQKMRAHDIVVRDTQNRESQTQSEVRIETTSIVVGPRNVSVQSASLVHSMPSNDVPIHSDILVPPAHSNPSIFSDNLAEIEQSSDGNIEEDVDSQDASNQSILNEKIKNELMRMKRDRTGTRSETQLAGMLHKYKIKQGVLEPSKFHARFATVANNTLLFYHSNMYEWPSKQISLHDIAVSEISKDFLSPLSTAMTKHPYAFRLSSQSCPRDDYIIGCESKEEKMLWFHSLRNRIKLCKSSQQLADIGISTDRGFISKCLDYTFALSVLYSLSGSVLDSVVAWQVRLCLYADSSCGDYSHSLTLRLLKESIVLELQQSNDGGTLFRGNTVATKLMKEYTKVIGRPFVQLSMGAYIRAIAEETSVSLEIDPVRIKRVRMKLLGDIRSGVELRSTHESTATDNENSNSRDSKSLWSQRDVCLSSIREGVSLKQANTSLSKKNSESNTDTGMIKKEGEQRALLSAIRAGGHTLNRSHVRERSALFSAIRSYTGPGSIVQKSTTSQCGGKSESVSIGSKSYSVSSPGFDGESSSAEHITNNEDDTQKTGEIQQTKAITLNDIDLSTSNEHTENMNNLIMRLNEAFELIVNSTDMCPLPLRELFGFIFGVVKNKFPGSEVSAVGGFLFLRLLCPCIINPISCNIVQKPLAPTALRSLVLVSKCLQNLSNEVYFGEKEKYLLPVNEFISEKLPLLHDFYSQFAATNTNTTTLPTNSPIVTQQHIISALSVVGRSEILEYKAIVLEYDGKRRMFCREHDYMYGGSVNGGGGVGIVSGSSDSRRNSGAIVTRMRRATKVLKI